MYDPVTSRVDFCRAEDAVQAFWDTHGTFEKSVEQRRGGKEFVFYDGPPFATGLPHYGHLLAGTIKDIVPRYQTMRGHYVARRFGWDCHGLPIEALAQEALGLAGTGAIKEAGVDVFNEQCRSMVQTYVEEWRRTVTRMGRWVDFDNDYKTMDPSFMETIWWVFGQLWEQGRIYKSYRIMPYSWKLTTPLSNFEANSNYKDVQDPAITVRAELLDGPQKTTDESWYVIVWTTTPWTLPENLAVCVGPDIDYVAVRDLEGGCIYVMAEARLEAYYPPAKAGAEAKPASYEIVERFKGSDLAGCRYAPIFPYFADTANAFRVLMDDFVSTEDGTGIVHMAPAYGEDDFRICREAKIDLVDPLDENGAFTDALPEYAGQFCKDADKAIIRRLKDEGKLVHQSTVKHSYPFCERTDTPLIYRAIEAWYIRVEDIRERLVELNNDIHWVPEYVGRKRFGNWLRDAKDWNISRNRYWGSCIPVWVNDADPTDMICVTSIAQLEELSGEKVDDLHKHIVDKIVIERDGKTYHRTPEVLDCWFESGAMPLAQQHYPFERGAELDSFYPADFIAEGLDQTRGWFYTLLVLSTLLFDKSCFRNVVVNGLILAEDGKKMSKRLKNYPDPMKVVHRYGADAIRLYMIHSPVVRAEDLRFSEKGVQEVMRHLLIPLWNAYSFFVTYANIDGWSSDQATGEPSSNVLDRWINSSLETLIASVTTAMDGYDLQRAVRPFVQFIEDLTNWYIRRSRRRFWKSQDDDDKSQAYATLYHVLIQLTKVAAPFVPFISESIYRNLRSDDMPESVHLCDFPTADGHLRDEELEEAMALVMICVKMGRQLRSEHNLKVRQPLSLLHVATRSDRIRKELEPLQDIIIDELNVKQVSFGDSETELAELKAKPDFKKLGPRLGPKVKAAAGVVARMSSDQLAALLEGETITVDVDGEDLALTNEDVVVERVPHAGLVVAAEGEILVALETQLTVELEREGLARELVNRIQNLRKEADFEVTQRIRVALFSSEAQVTEAVTEYLDYIQTETLCLACAMQDSLSGEMTELDLNGKVCFIHIEPV